MADIGSAARDLSRNRIVKGGAIALALVLLPIVFGPVLGTQILVYSIFALGYNLLLGYGGEMSFGHAAFFGIGAYGTVMTTQVVPNVFVAIAVGVVVSAIASALIGVFSLRRRGIYFSMITLAFAQMLYIVFLQATDLTGGSNGLIFPSIDAPELIAPGSGDLGFYFVVLVLLLLVMGVVRRIVYSPFGRVLVAIRENERRAESLGYDVDRFLLISFVISGIISGFAGALYALLFAFVSPNLLFWTTSGAIVMMTIIGGVGTLIGPPIGAAIYLVLSDYLTGVFDVWEIVFGLIIIVVVMLAPWGVYGLYLRQREGELAPGGLRSFAERFSE